MTSGRQPYDVKFDVAEKFWKYMHQSNTIPATRTALRQLYLESYRPFIADPVEKRVNFSTLFNCLKVARFLQTSGEDRDLIVYSKPSRRSEDESEQVKEPSNVKESSIDKPQPGVSKRKRKRSRRKSARKQKEDSRQDDSLSSELDLDELKERLKTQRPHLVKDKGNVTIRPVSNEDGVVDLGIVNRNESGTIQLYIRNECERNLIFGYAVLDLANNTTSYEAAVETEINQLDGFEQVTVPVEISAYNLGVFHVPLVFWFQCGKGEPFYIVKFVKVEIADVVIEQPVLSNDGQKDFYDLDKVKTKLTTQRHHLVKDKGNVTIQPTSDQEGVIDLGILHVETNKPKVFPLHIENKSDKNFVFGYGVLESANDCNEDTTGYEVTVETVDDKLDGHTQITVPIEICANNPGIFHVPLVFWFKCYKGEPFYIVKFIKVEIIDEVTMEEPPVSEERQEDFVDIAGLRKKLVTHRHHLAKDKGEIAILPLSNKDGVIDMGSVDISVSKKFQVHIRNKNDRKLCFGYVVLGSSCDFCVSSMNCKPMDENTANELDAFEYVHIGVNVNASNPGIFHMTLALWFKFGNDKPFTIVKFIKMELTDKLVNDLQPVSPYIKPKLVPRNSGPCEVVRGVAPPFDITNVSVKLGQYNIPPNMTCHEDYLARVFRGHLSARNHRERFSCLLYTEEIQMEKDIQRYDMEKVKLQLVPKGKGYLSLAVPGLAENRPSLVCGDRLLVHKLKADGKKENKLYEGFVYQIHLSEVYLKFSPDFHRTFVDRMSFSVQFTYNRTPLKLMHRALHMSSRLLRQLPWNEDKPDCIPVVAKTKGLRFYDPNIANNKEQRQAVENILFGTSRPYPYLVFGPPGSGKTVTIVEAIKQVLKNSPASKVLACAPSNSAADLILERVSEHNVVPNARMVRLNAYGRDSAIDPKIMKFCKRDSQGFFCFPSKEIMKQYKLVVTTLISAGRLVSMGIGDSHFTHVFIDEAGHGMEPEGLVPIAGLYNGDRNTGGQLVLAGDPKQLGPVLRSPKAIRFGLNVSLLERLMGPQFPCYGRQPDKVGSYDGKLVTKLLNNYRSHPAIIKLSNEMFYDNELRPCANQVLRECLCRWTGLKKKGFPVLFEGVCGKDQREEKSPSFFNPQEVSVVLRYVKQLKEARGISVKSGEIGIISPYHRQVQKIRQSLQKKAYDIRDIKVGSVEEFQGQERKVIIISTVRSSEKFLHLDAMQKLGFLRSPKRFNVAITRAKALLIVIGNPHVLCRDEYWGKFIKYCVDNGSYQGCAFEMPDVDDENLAAQLAKLGLNNDEAFYTRDENDTSHDYEDKEWKHGED